MTRLRLTRAPLALAALAVVLAPTTQADALNLDSHTAGSTTVHPGDLPRGAAPKIAWQEGNVVHTASGGRITLPWTKSDARRLSLRLVGKADAGWVVRTADGGRWETSFWLVKAGKKSRLGPAHTPSEGEWFDYGVSDDGQRMYYQRVDETTDDFIQVRNLPGKVVASEDLADDPEVLSFSGPEAVLGTEDAQLWDIDAGTLTPLGLDAAGASIKHDVLFVTGGSGESGPTPLSAPAAPAWTADMTNIRVSPDGSRVLSTPASNDQLVEVRDLATGALQHTFRLRWGWTPEWESATSFVFLGVVGRLQDREVLVRCKVSGRCTRISPIVPEDTITLPRVRE